MTTLIAVYNSDGCIGRCDAKCYQAAPGPCDCICQGKNHAAGKAQATANTRDLARQWVTAAELKAGRPLFTDLGRLGSHDLFDN